MFRRHFRKILFLTTILCLIGLIAIIFTTPPTTSYSLGFLPLPILLLFFPLCFIFVFGIVTLIFKRPVFGVLVGTLSLMLLFFRMVDLTHPLFLVLIFGLFITALLFFKKDKAKNS